MTRDELKSMIESGKTAKEIAEAKGTSRQNIYMFAKRHGLTLKADKRGPKKVEEKAVSE